ncbi:unnamed protein product [Amoebophrya sp. A120]|nr:unnamed protein product [Amoebophrya sp. A120]|eukprot:GSA120T00019793001.1
MSSEDSDEDENENQDQGAPLPDLSDPDFAQFVQYLGCDEETLQQDDDFTQGTLLRIMQEAYIAPLPPNWAEFSDPEGRIYFYNYATEQSSWAHPTDRTYRELIQMVKKVRSVPGPGVPKDEISRIIDVHLQGVHQRALEAIAGFSGPYQSEDGGHEYYYNEITKVSTWESPVTEWEHNISTRYHVLYRCLLEPLERAETDQLQADANSSEGGTPSASSKPNSVIPPKLQLPLHLVSGGGGSSSSTGGASSSSSLTKSASISTTGSSLLAPPTPSTTRSYHTARSQGSARNSSARANKVGRRSREVAGGGTTGNLLQPKPPEPDDTSEEEDEPFNFTFGSGAIVSKT